MQIKTNQAGISWKIQHTCDKRSAHSSESRTYSSLLLRSCDLIHSRRIRKSWLSQRSLEKHPEQKQGLQEVIPMTQQPRPTRCLILDNVLLDTLMFPHEWLMTKVLPTCSHKYLMTFFSRKALVLWPKLAQNSLCSLINFHGCFK